jgi:group I intron endonuclease
MQVKALKECSGVYIIVNDVNGHRYIGSSVDVYSRVDEHLFGKKGSASVRAAISKHGSEHFHAFLVEEVPRQELPVREAFWMKHYSPEYNRSMLTETGGRIVSEEQRERIRNSLSGRTLSPEHRASISASLLGHSISEETAAKIAESMLGQKRSPESIEKMRAVVWTAERKQKLREANLGKKASEETKQKKRDALKGKPWTAARRAAQDQNKA